MFDPPESVTLGADPLQGEPVAEARRAGAQGGAGIDRAAQEHRDPSARPHEAQVDRGRRTDRRRDHVLARQLLRHARRARDHPAGNSRGGWARTRRCCIRAARTWSKAAPNRARRRSSSRHSCARGRLAAAGTEGRVLPRQGVRRHARADAHRSARGVPLGPRRAHRHHGRAGRGRRRRGARRRRLLQSAGRANYCRRPPAGTRSSWAPTTASVCRSMASWSPKAGNSTSASPARARSWNSQAARPVDIKLEYFEADPRRRSAPRAGGCRAPSRRSKKHSMPQRPRTSSIFVGGLTGDVEGEEMRVNFPGFAGGDRTDLRLPQKPAETARSTAGHRQARGPGAHCRLRAGGGLGAGQTTRHPRGLVSRSARRQRGRRCAVRRDESRAAACRSLSTRPTKSCRTSRTTA